MIGVFLISLASIAVLGFALAVVIGEFRRHWPQVLATFAAPMQVTIIDPTPPAARPAIRRAAPRPSQPKRALAA